MKISPFSWGPVIAWFVALELLVSCSPRVTPSPALENLPQATVTATKTPLPSPTPSPEATKTLTAGPGCAPVKERKSTPTPTKAPNDPLLPFPTAVPVSLIPAVEPVFAGTPVPAAQEPIGADNIHALKNTAIWGKGTIRSVAFAPSGKTFVVGSIFGVAVYDPKALDQALRWILFKQPFGYDHLFFSADEQYLLLERADAKSALNLATGEISQTIPNLEWIRPASTIDGNYELTITSEDGSRRFEGGVIGRIPEKEDEFLSAIELSEEDTVRMVFNTASNELLYEMRDELPYVHYYEYNSPEGCDLKFFSPCGNALMALATAPYRAAFSPAGDTLSILYRPPSLYDPDEFSYLRIYDSANGKLISNIGSFKQPVEDFAYSPDGVKLLIGFQNGTVQLWDIRQRSSSFLSNDFNPPLSGYSMTNDRQFLLLQYQDTLQIRRSRDGAVLSTHDSVEFTVSPVENRIAIGTQTGTINLYDINSGQITHLQGHRDRVLALAFSEDGQFLASSGQDCAIHYWDVATGKRLHGFKNAAIDAHGEPSFHSRIFVNYLEFIPGTDQLFGFGSWATTASWNVNSGESLYVVPAPPLEYYQGMVTVKPRYPNWFTIDLDGGRFIINNTAFDLFSGAELGEYIQPQIVHEDCNEYGDLTKDGRLLLSGGYDQWDGSFCVLDSQTYQLVQLLEAFPLEALDYIGAGGPILSPDGNFIFLPTWDGVVFVYQIMK